LISNIIEHFETGSIETGDFIEDNFTSLPLKKGEPSNSNQMMTIICLATKNLPLIFSNLDCDKP